MAKKAVKKTLWEQIKEAWAEAFAGYKDMWKAAWVEYKTIVGPFVKGTFTYAWNLVYGSLKCLSAGIYATGKLVYEYIIRLIEKA